MVSIKMNDISIWNINGQPIKKTKSGFKTISLCKNCDGKKYCSKRAYMAAGNVPSEITGGTFKGVKLNVDGITADIQKMYDTDNCKNYMPKKDVII